MKVRSKGLNQIKLKVKNTFNKAIFKAQGKDKGIHVLTYHGLIEQRSHPRLQRNFHTVKEFKEHVKRINASGAKVLSPKEFEEHLENSSLHKLKKAFLQGSRKLFKKNGALEKQETV